MDAEAPPQTLIYTLGGNPPVEAQLDANSGQFQWPVPVGTAAGDYVFTVVVLDDGDPVKSSSRDFVVMVSVSEPVGITPPSANGDVSLSFATVPGRFYRVEYKAELDQAQWQVLRDRVEATGASLTIQDNVNTSGPKRFYRMVELQ